MPQPVIIKPIGFSANAAWVMQHNPACLTAVGLIALTWTNLEQTLISLLSGVFGRTSRADDGSRGIAPHWIAQAAIEEAETIRAKQRLMSATLGKFVVGSEFEAEWSKLSDEINKRSKERNRVVHTNWGWSEEMPAHLLEFKGNRELISWTYEDLIAVHSRIADLKERLWDFQMRVLDAIHDRRLTNYVTPDMIVEQ